jgi:hypothetical protein
VTIPRHQPLSAFTCKDFEAYSVTANIMFRAVRPSVCAKLCVPCRWRHHWRPLRGGSALGVLCAVRVCVRVCLHTCTHTHTRRCTRHVYVCTCTHGRKHKDAGAVGCVCTCGRLFIRVSAYVGAVVSVRVCVRGRVLCLGGRFLPFSVFLQYQSIIIFALKAIFKPVERLK